MRLILSLRLPKGNFKAEPLVHDSATEIPRLDTPPFGGTTTSTSLVGQTLARSPKIVVREILAVGAL